LIRWGERWRSAATNALVAMGLTQPKRHFSQAGNPGDAR
jgi:hypothetical protein